MSNEDAADDASMIRHVGSLTEWQYLLLEADDKLVVVDFNATWCGPCKKIHPHFVKLAQAYGATPSAGGDGDDGDNSDTSGAVIFVEVDVDDADDVAAECDVKAMPTFQFYKKGTKVDELKGADPEQLAAKVLEHKQS